VDAVDRQRIPKGLGAVLFGYLDRCGAEGEVKASRRLRHSQEPGSIRNGRSFAPDLRGIADPA
jgi:hypothetical protein